jgi:hypothetical protein
VGLLSDGGSLALGAWVHSRGPTVPQALGWAFGARAAGKRCPTVWWQARPMGPRPENWGGWDEYGIRFPALMPSPPSRGPYWQPSSSAAWTQAQRHDRPGATGRWNPVAAGAPCGALRPSRCRPVRERCRLTRRLARLRQRVRRGAARSALPAGDGQDRPDQAAGAGQSAVVRRAHPRRAIEARHPGE